MTKSIQREILIPQPREQVWQALTNSDTLAEWMFPNDIEPRVGHHFTFRVPPNPKVGFEGMIVSCEVLECEPPCRLAFSWSAGGLTDTRVSFRLEPDDEGTRIHFEHSGFDISQTWSEQAFHGAEYGWAKMLGQLPAVVAGAFSHRSGAESSSEDPTVNKTAILSTERLLSAKDSPFEAGDFGGWSRTP